MEASFCRGLSKRPDKALTMDRDYEKPTGALEADPSRTCLRALNGSGLRGCSDAQTVAERITIELCGPQKSQSDLLFKLLACRELLWTRVETSF